MISWQECCNKVGYVTNDSGAPTPIKIIYAYRNGFKVGESVGMNYLKVKQLFPDCTLEEVVQNQAEINVWRAERQRIWDEAYMVWFSSLREEWLPSLYGSDKLFDKAFSESYDRGHSYGYDEVASYMIGVVGFIREVIEISKKEEI